MVKRGREKCCCKRIGECYKMRQKSCCFFFITQDLNEVALGQNQKKTLLVEKIYRICCWKRCTLVKSKSYKNIQRFFIVVLFVCLFVFFQNFVAPCFSIFLALFSNCPAVISPTLIPPALLLKLFMTSPFPPPRPGRLSNKKTTLKRRKNKFSLNVCYFNF